MLYAIMITGAGEKQRFSIQQVIDGRGTNPVNGRIYRTESDARAAAAEMGIEIHRVGTFYEII